jgi:hypothetical protein
MPNNANQHSHACIAVRAYLKSNGYRFRSNLATMNPGRADLTVWGQGAVTLELEIKTGKGKLSSDQQAERNALFNRKALYKTATVNKLPNGRYDMKEVFEALLIMDNFNTILNERLTRLGIV